MPILPVLSSPPACLGSSPVKALYTFVFVLRTLSPGMLYLYSCTLYQATGSLATLPPSFVSVLSPCLSVKLVPSLVPFFPRGSSHPRFHKQGEQCLPRRACLGGQARFLQSGARTIANPNAAYGWSSWHRCVLCRHLISEIQVHVWEVLPVVHRPGSSHVQGTSM